MSIIYGLLLLNMYFALDSFEEAILEDDYTKIINWSVIQASIGFKVQNFSNGWPLILIIQVLLIL